MELDYGAGAVTIKYWIRKVGLAQQSGWAMALISGFGMGVFPSL
jgi:hypothetical protein